MGVGEVRAVVSSSIVHVIAFRPIDIDTVRSTVRRQTRE